METTNRLQRTKRNVSILGAIVIFLLFAVVVINVWATIGWATVSVIGMFAGISVTSFWYYVGIGFAITLTIISSLFIIRSKTK